MQEKERKGKKEKRKRNRKKEEAARWKIPFRMKSEIFKSWMEAIGSKFEKEDLLDKKTSWWKKDGACLLEWGPFESGRKELRGESRTWKCSKGSNWKAIRKQLEQIDSSLGRNEAT